MKNLETSLKRSEIASYHVCPFFFNDQKTSCSGRGRFFRFASWSFFLSFPKQPSLTNALISVLLKTFPGLDLSWEECYFSWRHLYISHWPLSLEQQRKERPLTCFAKSGFFSPPVLEGICKAQGSMYQFITKSSVLTSPQGTLQRSIEYSSQYKDYLWIINRGHRGKKKLKSLCGKWTVSLHLHDRALIQTHQISRLDANLAGNYCIRFLTMT